VVHGTLQAVLVVLLVVAAVGVVCQRIRIHASIALVLTGAALGVSGLMPALALDPEVVLQVLLPILLFEAAISTDVRRLRENLAPVALLAGPGVLVAVAVGGGVLHLGLGLNWPLALLLAAVLAPTDTLAVLGVVREVRAPSRLAAIVENESLFNDGTALVAFSTLLVVVQEGRFDPARGAWAA
jgi:CPA1 family monovalent cation:H+ antiporter